MHLDVSTQVPDGSALLTKSSHAQTRLSLLIGKPIRHALVLQDSSDHFCEVPLAASEPVTCSVRVLTARQVLNFHISSPP